MRKSKERINYKFDGRGFTYVNPEFIKEEREKILSMSTEKAIDYLLCNSVWSVAYKKDKWEKEKNGKITVYKQKKHNKVYNDVFCCMVEELSVRTLVLCSDNDPVYTRSVTGTLTYDDGSCEREYPILEREYGDVAIDIMTGGLWNAILGENKS